MARFRIQIDTPLPPGEAWDRLLDLTAHDVVIPLTDLREGAVPARAIADGHGFLAWTGIGPVGFHDPMTVTSIEHPSGDAGAGRARIVKTGRAVGGEVEIRVEPAPGGTCAVTDRVTFVPRVRWAGRLHRRVVLAIFRHRHRRLRARYGSAPAERPAV